MIAHLFLPLLLAADALPVQPAGWQPWAYVYGVGGAVFLIGLIICIRTRQIDLGQRRGRLTLLLMVAGFVGYALLQGIMQLVLPEI